MASQTLESGLHVVENYRAAAPLPFRDLDKEPRSNVAVFNDSGIDTPTILRAAVDQHPDLAPLRDALVTWTSGPGPNYGYGRAGGLMDRDFYVNTANVFDEMRVATRAAEDDMVAAFLDSSEALAFSRMEVECDEEDEMDIWRQIMDDIDLDSRMREIWRDLNIYSQCYVAVWFGRKTYKVTGKNSQTGVRRKKQFGDLTVPLGVTTLDPLKVVPVGNFLFQQETLCLPASAHIYTPEGPKSIVDIEVGDQVWSLEGQSVVPATVGQKRCTGTKRLWRIKTPRHDLQLTANHPVLVMDRGGTPFTREKVSFEWLRADEVSTGDFLVCAKATPEAVAGEYPSEGIARLVGVLVGDGSRNPHLNDAKPGVRGNVQSWMQIAAHVDELEGWTNLIQTELNVVPQIYPHRMSTHAASIHFTSQDLVPWVREVMSFKSPERFVPSWVWTAPKAIQMAFLEGYLEADGHEKRKSPGCFRVSCASERLVRELRVLCHYLGYKTGMVMTADRAPSTLVTGRIITPRHLFFSFNGSRSAPMAVPSTYSKGGRSRQAAFETEDLCAQPVQVSEVTDEWAEVWDIGVEETHNFVVEGVVVHNCYYANPTEKDVIDSWLLGDDDSGADEIIKRLIIAKFEPDFRDRKEIGNLGIDPNRLYVLNPKYVWRHTTTKAGYDRFAPLRFRSIFETLDLKRQLKQMDRALLLGAKNYILLIKKGSDKEPAKQFEISNLQQMSRTLTSVPILVGDHRLSIEIVTPKIDNVLDETKYQLLDLRLAGRLWGMFLTTHSGRDDSLKLARVVARGLESRRLMQKRAFMRKVIMPTYEMNDGLTSPPDLLFYPKRIALDFDPSLATYLLDLRDRGDLSRDSVLAEIDYDEASEAAKRQVEKDKYDEIFTAPASQLPPGTPDIPGVPKPPPLQTPPAPSGTQSTKPKPAPGGPNDPKRAGRALGGNHGRGGNGNIGRGAGQAAKPKPNPAGGGPAGKNIRSRPKLDKPAADGD